MSGGPVEPAALAAPRGFYGKLPSRGDFVERGLPRGFVARWDAWLADRLPAARAALGGRFPAAWMEAPVWRFALPAGLCGEDAVLGVWMPSQDRVGRLFPLTLATTGPDLDRLARDGAAWLDIAETQGILAVTEDREPDGLAAALRAETRSGDSTPVPALDGEATWWTRGSPFVPACVLRTGTMPDRPHFAAMLHAMEETP